MKMLKILAMILLCGCSSTSDSNLDVGYVAQGVVYDNKYIVKVSSGDYALELISQISTDTLSGEWQDEVYGSPIVNSQKLLFYEKGVVVNSIAGPVNRTLKLARNTGEIYVSDLVLFDICLGRTSQGVVYKVEGSGFCYGLSCPEYTGVFSSAGEAIYEKPETALLENSNPMLSPSYDITYEECKSIVSLWKR